jgi:hypothetical protein
VEFITIIWFDSLASVRQFAGEDYERAVVLSQAHALLAIMTLVPFIMRWGGVAGQPETIASASISQAATGFELSARQGVLA